MPLSIAATFGVDRLLLSFELLGERDEDLVALDAEQLGDDADVDHVRQQLAQLASPSERSAASFANGTSKKTTSLRMALQLSGAS